MGGFFLTILSTAAAFTQAPKEPYIVKLYEPPREEVGVAEVLIRALGFSGLMMLLAIVAAAAAGAFLFWRRSRAE